MNASHDRARRRLWLLLSLTLIACGPGAAPDASRDASVSETGDAASDTATPPADAPADEGPALDASAPDAAADESPAPDATIEPDVSAPDAPPAMDVPAPDATAPDATPMDAPLNRDVATDTRDAGPAPDVATDAPGDAGPTRPSVRHTYRATDAIFPNPERGFYRYASLPENLDFDEVLAGGNRLIYSYVHLDDYRTRRIDAAYLTQVTTALAAVRAAGLSVILRFAYNDGPYPDPEPDASRDMVATHIAQVGPLLRANADVIFAVQAGFIGAWGEWHSSTNGLENNADRRAIVEALLNAMPPERMTQIRVPQYKFDIWGPALTAANGFSGSVIARIGHHNDCLLSSATDVGTYPRDRQAELERSVAQDTLFVPIGGETCEVFAARTDCLFAVGELERLHYTYINQDYHPQVVSRWRTQGCFDTLQRRLGYRFALTTADFPDTVARGEAVAVRIDLRNDGFAPMYNARPVFLRFDQGARTELVPLAGADPRRWPPGAHSVTATVTIPSTLAVGDATLSLWLPHGTEALRSRAIYSVRLANETVWNESRGANALGTVRIER